MTFSTIPGPMPPARRPGDSRPAPVPPRGPSPPIAVRLAVGIALVQVAVAFLGLPMTVSDELAVDALWDLVHDLGLTSDGSTGHDIADGVFVVGLLLGAVVWVGLAALVWQGRAWARAVMTVLAGLAVLGAISRIAGVTSEDLPIIVQGLVDIALAIALLTCLYLPGTAPWFAAGPRRSSPDIAVTHQR